jgi:hypothetical protein
VPGMCALPPPPKKKIKRENKNSKAVDEKTFLRNVIKDDGGIPGFETFACEMIMSSDFIES